MKTKKAKGMIVVGSLRSDGITTYMKQGKVIIRASKSMQKRSNTLAQFVQRQKMRHAVALWKILKYIKPMFTERATAYGNFVSLAIKLPVVYVEEYRNDTFLMPGIPVSDGRLPAIKEKLGEVDGEPALLTDLKVGTIGWSKLWLYTAEQDELYKTVRFDKRQVDLDEMVAVDGCYALKGEEFANPMKGWALVLVNGERCSPQTIVTRCTLYQQFTTDEALQEAAKSYKGLTKDVW